MTVHTLPGSRWIARTLLVVCGLGLLSVGCDTSFEPFADTDQRFTLMGFLDTDAARQYLRVVPLRTTVDRSQPLPIDASLKSFDGTTEVVWTDSLTRFPDQTYGHVFWADFAAQPSTSYRVDVTRSDGASVTATTTVPATPVDPSRVHGVLNETPKFAPVFFPGVTRVIDVDVTYTVWPTSCNATVPPPLPLPQDAFRKTIRHRKHQLGSIHQNGEWQVLLNLEEDRDSLEVALKPIGNPACITVYSVEVRIATPDDKWNPPGGIWDPDVLGQPGIFSNVEGGFGYFGSVARTTANHQLGPFTMQQLNYFPYIPG